MFVVLNIIVVNHDVKDGLMPGEVYAGGSVFALKRAMGWHGRRVLYVGDNLFADLVQVAH